MSSPVSTAPSAHVSESPSLAPNETCATLAYPPAGFASNCRAWRSCRSCLQKTGCVVTSSSRCARKNETGLGPNSDADYRNAFTLNLTLPNATVSNPQGLVANQSWVFPAIETTYCPFGDATCDKCKRELFYRPGGFVDSRFCVGAGGCVCVFNCEILNPMEPHSICSDEPTPVTTAPSADDGPSWLSKQPSSQTTLVLVLVIPICTMVVATVYCIIRAKRQRATQAAHVQAQPPRARGSRQVEIEAVTLGLSGWNQHRQKLITDEHRRLAGVDDADSTAFAQLHTPTSSTTATPPATGPSRTDL